MKILGRLFVLFLIPIVLLLFWIVAPVVLNSNNPLLVIVSSYNKYTFKPFNGDEIHAGEKIVGILKSKENNLGILAVRFNTFDRINSDVVIFRIKELNENNWYYTGKYKVDQFQPNDFFTFGFPKIPDSENKTYAFEIESTKGEKGDAVALSYFEPTVMAKYAYSKGELFQNKKDLLLFTLKKISYSYQSFSFFISSLPFLLPLFFYAFLLSVSYRFIKKRYPFFHQVFTLILLLSLIFLPAISSMSFFLLVSFWVLLIVVNKLESTVSFMYALVLLLVTPLLIFADQKFVAENFARWTYYFFAIGTLQLIYELKAKPKDLANYQDVLKSFIGAKNFGRISAKLKSVGKYV